MPVLGSKEVSEARAVPVLVESLVKSRIPVRPVRVLSTREDEAKQLKQKSRALGDNYLLSSQVMGKKH